MLSLDFSEGIGHDRVASQSSTVPSFQQVLLYLVILFSGKADQHNLGDDVFKLFQQAASSNPTRIDGLGLGRSNICSDLFRCSYATHRYAKVPSRWWGGRHGPQWLVPVRAIWELLYCTSWWCTK